ncbi:hypothetical protein GQ53DRAFT_352563 [Thozetella sp. PMI_491]|nr:hypothetical protein GQ53DRAFT_352563 [Thozetella sp. PMI_491]
MPKSASTVPEPIITSRERTYNPLPPRYVPEIFVQVLSPYAVDLDPKLYRWERLEVVSGTQRSTVQGPPPIFAASRNGRGAQSPMCPESLPRRDCRTVGVPSIANPCRRCVDTANRRLSKVRRLQHHAARLPASQLRRRQRRGRRKHTIAKWRRDAPTIP